MAKPLQPFGLDPVGAQAGWLDPGAGGYLLYRGTGAAAAIDYVTPVGFAQAGAVQVVTDPDVEFVDGATYHLALRAVSDAGIAEDNTTCQARAEISGETVIGEIPNAVSKGQTAAAAGGTIKVTVWRQELGSTAVAATLRLAAVPASGLLGGIDWNSPIKSWTVRLGQIVYTYTTDPYAHGTNVRLAARAFTSGGVGGDILRLPVAVADTSGPEPVGYITGEMVA